jgi:hypothetical protein
VTDAHRAFREAHAYVGRYFDQLACLLNDGREELERRGYRMLRPNGDRYVSDVDSVATKPGQWIASWLFAFFAPASAFEGRAYGVPARTVERVSFLAGALGDLPECPAIWIGWIEGHDREGNLESKLREFYNAIHPPTLAPEPQPMTRLGALAMAPASVPDSSLRVGLARVPMALIAGRKDVITLIENLIGHLER